MSHRPYPSPDRARHQLDRHGDETGPLALPRLLSPFEQQMAEAASAATRAAVSAETAFETVVIAIDRTESPAARAAVSADSSVLVTLPVPPVGIALIASDRRSISSSSAPAVMRWSTTALAGHAWAVVPSAPRSTVNTSPVRETTRTISRPPVTAERPGSRADPVRTLFEPYLRRTPRGSRGPRLDLVRTPY